jgi:hypothetical protein
MAIAGMSSPRIINFLMSLSRVGLYRSFAQSVKFLSAGCATEVYAAGGRVASIELRWENPSNHAAVFKSEVEVSKRATQRYRILRGNQRG